MLHWVLAIAEMDRDALPGSAVKHVKAAVTIMRKRRKKDDQNKLAKERREPTE